MNDSSEDENGSMVGDIGFHSTVNIQNVYIFYRIKN